ncbi:MAG: hypothetical protein AOA65_2172 [Candidatus Bathyarchaeota archaeon BA1]|nr:MAG: hypothetical protein AOA65_2172 [Candidatus Bathyarchaeota archaeon BA1]
MLEVIYMDGTIVMTKLEKRGNLELALKLLGRGLPLQVIEKRRTF